MSSPFFPLHSFFGRVGVCVCVRARALDFQMVTTLLNIDDDVFLHEWQCSAGLA